MYDYDVIVVGAGPSGITAANAASTGGWRVALLEAGGVFDSRLLDPDLFAALDVPAAWWPDPNRYRGGMGVGGGGAINGMVCVPGDQVSYEWNPQLPALVADDLARTATVPLGLLSSSVAAPLAAAFGAPSSIGIESFDREGWAAAALWMDTGPLRRRAPWLDPAVSLFTDTEVLSVTEDSTGVAVITPDAEWRARHVVLAAGVVGTPLLLARSGVENSHLGRHVADHAAVTFRLSTGSAGSAPGMAKRSSRITAVARFRSSANIARPDIQVMPIEPTAGTHGNALVMVALTSPQSSGRLDLSDGLHPTLHLGHLDHVDDRSRLRNAVRTTVRALSTTEHHALLADESDASVLLDHTNDELDQWMIANLGGYYHATGSARCAVSPLDGVTQMTGQVHGLGSVWVADVSMVPVPLSGNPMLMARALGQFVGKQVADRLLRS